MQNMSASRFLFFIEFPTESLQYFDKCYPNTHHISDSKVCTCSCILIPFLIIKIKIKLRIIFIFSLPFFGNIVYNKGIKGRYFQYAE